MAADLSRGNDFWDFSLGVYGAPGVADACLRLQDRYGLDVNLALYCCWRAATGQGQASWEVVAAAQDAVGAWHEAVVQPLRAVRRRLRDDVRGIAPADRQAFCSALKQLELDAERLEQDVLAALPENRVGGAAEDAEAAALEGLRTYMRSLGRRIDPAADADLARIAAAAAEGSR